MERVDRDVRRMHRLERAVGSTFTLYITPESEDDAFEGFERGSDYLMFAVRNSARKRTRFRVPDPAYGATNCGGTIAVLWGTRYMVDLGPGNKPE